MKRTRDLAARTIHVIPAVPGNKAVLDVDGEVWVDKEDIIAWRFETCTFTDGASTSVCMPLTVHGDMVSNGIGVQQPNGAIVIFEDRTYPTLADYGKARHAETGASIA